MGKKYICKGGICECTQNSWLNPSSVRRAHGRKEIRPGDIGARRTYGVFFGSGNHMDTWTSRSVGRVRDKLAGIRNTL